MCRRPGAGRQHQGRSTRTVRGPAAFEPRASADCPRTARLSQDRLMECLDSLPDLHMTMARESPSVPRRTIGISTVVENPMDAHRSVGRPETFGQDSLLCVAFSIHVAVCVLDRQVADGKSTSDARHRRSTIDWGKDGIVLVSLLCSVVSQWATSSRPLKISKRNVHDDRFQLAPDVGLVAGCMCSFWNFW